MNKKLKRGDAVAVVYKKLDQQYVCYGVVLKNDNKNLLIGHNFNGTQPIDTTRISLKSVIVAIHIKPKE